MAQRKYVCTLNLMFIRIAPSPRSAGSIQLAHVFSLQECRESVFLPAQKEIFKILEANLFGKFKATEEYREFADELVFEAS